jgi:hypothetical protein
MDTDKHRYKEYPRETADICPLQLQWGATADKEKARSPQRTQRTLRFLIKEPCN